MNKLNKGLCDRFKQVRVKHDLTQTAFGGKLGIRQGDVSNIEKYRIEPSKAIILSIIEKFNINGHWLLTGIGEMYNRKSLRINEPAASYNANDSLVAEIKKLREENERLKKFILRVATKEELDQDDKGNL